MVLGRKRIFPGGGRRNSWGDEVQREETNSSETLSKERRKLSKGRNILGSKGGEIGSTEEAELSKRWAQVLSNWMGEKFVKRDGEGLVKWDGGTWGERDRANRIQGEGETMGQMV